VRAIENDIPMVAGDAYPAGLMVDELRAMTDVLSAEL
jgi:hypothetical protein